MSLHTIAPMQPHLYETERDCCRWRKESTVQFHCAAIAMGLSASPWKETSEELKFLLLVSLTHNSSTAIIMCRWEHLYYYYPWLIDINYCEITKNYILICSKYMEHVKPFSTYYAAPDCSDHLSLFFLFPSQTENHHKYVSCVVCCGI